MSELTREEIEIIFESKVYSLDKAVGVMQKPFVNMDEQELKIWIDQYLMLKFGVDKAKQADNFIYYVSRLEPKTHSNTIKLFKSVIEEKQNEKEKQAGIDIIDCIKKEKRLYMKKIAEKTTPNPNLLINKDPRKRMKNRAITGIYGLYKDDILVYIGQALNIENRVKGHLKDKDFDYYRIIEECKKEDLDETERKYIAIFSPKLNMQKYQGSDNGKIFVNEN
jgi:hypothetical protein